MIEVVAHMVASVVGVQVAAGQRVAEGDTLLVVESMKMEIPVLAPVAGTVAELRVGAADIVVEGDVLAVIDPGPARWPQGAQARSALEMLAPQSRASWAWPRVRAAPEVPPADGDPGLRAAPEAPPAGGDPGVRAAPEAPPAGGDRPG